MSQVPWNKLQKYLKLVLQKFGTLQFPSPSGLGFQVEKLIVANLKVGKIFFPYPFLGFFHENRTKVNCSSCNISKQLVDFIFIKDTQPRSWNCKWLKIFLFAENVKKTKIFFEEIKWICRGSVKIQIRIMRFDSIIIL